MNRPEFAKGIKILELAYNQKFTQEKIDFWWRQLQDIKANRFYDNIRKMIKTSEFLPNIAQLRGESIQKADVNFEQRDYSNFDFNKIYANKGV